MDPIIFEKSEYERSEIKRKEDKKEQPILLSELMEIPENILMIGKKEMRKNNSITKIWYMAYTE